MAERLGNEQVMANTLSYMCSSLMRQADLPETSAADRAALLEEAYRHGTKAIDLLVRLPKSTGLVFALGFLTETCFAMGKMDEAVERLATADKIAEELEWTVWPTLAAELHQKRDLHVTRSTPRTAGNSEAFPPASGGSAIPRGG